MERPSYVTDIIMPPKYLPQTPQKDIPSLDALSASVGQIKITAPIHQNITPQSSPSTTQRLISVAQTSAPKSSAHRRIQFLANADKQTTQRRPTTTELTPQHSVSKQRRQITLPTDGAHDLQAIQVDDPSTPVSTRPPRAIAQPPLPARYVPTNYHIINATGNGNCYFGY